MQRDLKGSPARDAFKHWHKSLHGSFYALDLDFLFVEKNPCGIVAAVDYKARGDSITFSEVIAYNSLLKLDIPVYIVTSDTTFSRFWIARYLAGDWRPFPPVTRTQSVLANASPKDFERWEQQLRANWKVNHE